MSSLAAFVGISLLVIVIPGQDTALTIRNTLVGGRRAGVLTWAQSVSSLPTTLTLPLRGANVRQTSDLCKSCF